MLAPALRSVRHMRHLTRADVRIHGLLRTARTVAVVEPPRQRGRPGRAVLDYLVAAGFDVIPVREDQAPIDGLPSFPRVADIPGAVDLVLLLGARGRETQTIDDAADKRVDVLWCPPGRATRAIRDHAEQRGVPLVVDRDIVRDLRTWIRQAGKPTKPRVGTGRRRQRDARATSGGGWAEAGGGGGVGGGGGRAVLDEKKMVPGPRKRGRRTSRRRRAA